MIRTSMRLAATALALAALPAYATTTTTKVTFTGVVTQSLLPRHIVVGETVSGSFTITVDPARSNVAGVPGKSADIFNDYFATGGPLVVKGAATFADGTVVAMSPTPVEQHFAIGVDRDGQTNWVSVSAATDVGYYDETLAVSVKQSQADCAVRCMYVDQDGLSPYQPLDLSAPGVKATGFYNGTDYYGTFSGTFDLTSLSIVQVSAPVPEPAGLAMMLAGAGLIGAMARRRRA